LSPQCGLPLRNVTLPFIIVAWAAIQTVPPPPFAGSLAVAMRVFIPVESS
jgi:hypothetical protein